MFEAFLEFAGCPQTQPIRNEEEFLTLYGGKSFLKGMYRLFKNEDRAKWTAITEDAFPAYRGTLFIFGFDWGGRIFAVSKGTGTVLLLEPGTGDVYDIPVPFAEFHDEVIVQQPDAALESESFQVWFQQNQGYELAYHECAGYKIPLFLNGEDVEENMEVSDMEVYWAIMGPLLQQ